MNCYLCRDGCCIMWPCMLWSAYHCAWHFLFVYFVRQCIHWAIPTSARFLLEIFLWRLVIFLRYACRPRTCGWCVILARVHRRMASNSTFCPLSLSREKAQAVSRSKQSSKWPLPENFLAIGGCFERYMYRVTTLGWLKKEYGTHD